MEADGVDPQELAASLKQAVRSPVRRTLQWGPWSTEQEIARMIKLTGVQDYLRRAKEKEHDDQNRIRCRPDDRRHVHIPAFAGPNHGTQVACTEDLGYGRTGSYGC